MTRPVGHQKHVSASSPVLVVIQMWLKWMVFSMKNPIKMEDKWGSPILGNPHLDYV